MMKLDQKAVEKALGSSIESMTQMTGDVSSRRYYRALYADGKTSVIMLTDSPSIDLFVEASVFMEKAGLCVPKILGRGVNFLLLEDLGDLTLQSAKAEMTEEKIRSVYGRIMDDLFEFQKFCATTAEKNFIGFSLRFDTEKLKFESDFAIEHFVKTRSDKTKISPEETENARTAFTQINTILAEQTEVLCHRDFHSRNIMMIGDEPTYIDYQSARTGRFLYDPVSLLYDPYVELPEGLAEDLLKIYFERLTAENMIDYGEKNFMEFAALSAIQRLFKALGTYGYQRSKMGKDDYEKYIPVACRRIITLLDVIEFVAFSTVSASNGRY